jgi:hypothetical protein
MRTEITITVDGGIVQDIEGIPPNVVVVVRDYDCEPDDKAAELGPDDRPCVVSFWEPKPEAAPQS